MSEPAVSRNPDLGTRIPDPASRNKLRLQSMDYSVLQQCMHCGMCLPDCPTYQETGRERNSPRGRIALMRGIADGDLELTQSFGDEMYYCLGCLACVTACPAGVDYPHLFEAARADIEDAGVVPGKQRTFWRWLSVKTIFMSPRLLHWVGRSLRLYQVSGLNALVRKLKLTRLLPKRLADLEPTTPKVQAKFSTQLIDNWEYPAGGQPKYRLGFLTGCVQDLVFSDVNRDTVDVLLANNCAVFTPRQQSCCGSLHAHNGELELAKELARRQLDTFDLDALDGVISNAGGCGSHLKGYGHLLADDPDYAERARQWDAKLFDIHEWLIKIDFRAPRSSSSAPASRITYHDSCHLCHGQKIARQPRDILRRIPGIELVELPEASWCCGSAGIYNITQPEQAGKLQLRKMDNIAKTGCSLVATANPGCHLQLENGFKLTGESGQVRHPASILAEAYRAETDS